ncbi:Aldo/keto reductase [Stereum hirsutum FP-91666 SS1]|uniref:Aldo/keto reductase n=1 Tax=Stereum hirsutum (strain FP-91666) TaxID=721885 RepID=UPI000440AFE1|nr:Aldo/keto reductase [Stereum hirsutum FP-91666 SS1]EIM91237.1 Aldo/keto reductase [Stereum hirsutum FP-91666 SS1]
MPAQLPTRKIGTTDVSSIGFGAMGIGGFSYSSTDAEKDNMKFLDEVYERGCRMWDTADCYGDSEKIIGQWFKRTGKRNEIFICTKVGYVFGDRVVNGEPEYLKSAVEKSLGRLGVDQIDLLYLHRADLQTPIEKSIEALAEFVKAGKVKYLGVSEASAAALRRAHSVHPISAYQVEYSPFALDVEDPKIGIMQTCKELNITLVAYSPLARGVLTGQYKSPKDFPEGDTRPFMPRFSEENFPNILQLVEDIDNVGKKHNATAAQVTLAWLMAQGENVIPIPGTRNVKRLDENLGAATVKLTPEEVATLRKAAEKADLPGVPRYPPGFNDHTFIDSPSL